MLRVYDAINILIVTVWRSTLVDPHAVRINI